jgi:hypothetical protein
MGVQGICAALRSGSSARAPQRRAGSRIDRDRVRRLVNNKPNIILRELQVARAPRGQRIHEDVPGGHWKIVTILGAMNYRGMPAAMTIEAATDREIFLAYLDQVLCPKLRAGHVVVMYNLSAHKLQGVRERIERAGGLVALPSSLLA